MDIIFYTLVYIVLVSFIAIAGIRYAKLFRKINNRLKNKWLRQNIKLVIINLFILVFANLYFFIFQGNILNNSAERQELIAEIIVSLLYLNLIILCIFNYVYVFEKIILKKLKKFWLKQLLIFIIIFLSPSVYLLIAIAFTGNMHVDTSTIFALFIISIILAVIRLLFNYYEYEKTVALNAKLQELSRLQELKTRAELNLLQSRINPHFLYNSLSSIAMLVYEEPQKAEEMIIALSKLFRYSMNKDEQDWITVEKELEVIELYLKIEKVRFDDRLQYSINCQSETRQYLIPCFLLQPIVENAIKHGISKITGQGIISIKIMLTPEGLLTNIIDNGPDFPEYPVSGYGLKYLQEKLELLFNHDYQIELKNSPEKSISILIKKPRKL